MNTPNAPQCGTEPELARGAQLAHVPAVSARDDRPQDREARKALRQSYGCDCCNDADPVLRPGPEQADITLAVVKEWTGIQCSGCPWRALSSPIVCRVFDLWTYFDKQHLAMYRPEPSHRELEGVMFLQTMIRRMDAQQRALDAKNDDG